MWGTVEYESGRQDKKPKNRRLARSVITERVSMTGSEGDPISERLGVMGTAAFTRVAQEAFQRRDAQGAGSRALFLWFFGEFLTVEATPRTCALSVKLYL